MTILDVIIPYPDFVMGEMIDPEQFDLNNEYTIRKLNEITSVINRITDNIDAGGSGADLISLTPIAPFVSNKLQLFLAEVITKLTSVADGDSGADFVASTPIAGVTGSTVKAQLMSLKNLLDAHKASVVLEIARVDARIEANNTEISTLKTRSTSLEGRSTSSEGRVGALESETASLKGRATSLEGRATSVEGRASALELGKANKTDVYTKSDVDAKKFGTASILDGAVTTVKLANQSVTADKIHPSLVENASVSVHKNLSVIDHPDQSVTTAKLRDLSVTTEKIRELSVTTEKLAVEGVTYDKLGLDIQQILSESGQVTDPVTGGIWVLKISNSAIYFEKVN